ncbi:MAG: F0F1 ATP synthase subunit delta [Micrococcales bacterium]|nr:F0F1 ATP synthase subunit delta [Micrococcales bacterium]
MRGTSRASLTALSRTWEPVVSRAKSKALDLGTELFAVVDALDANPSLLRALSDPAATAAAKAKLAADVLTGADARVVTVVGEAAGQRWSADRDLADALEVLGRSAVLGSAEAKDQLDTVEDELFRIGRALHGQREVRTALTDAAAPPQGRAQLAEAILGGRATPATVALARRAAQAPRGTRFVPALGHLADLIAERRDRKVATVTTAAPLTAAQTARLADILGRVLGREVALNVSVDPRVVGGLKVQSGSDVVDATVLARLADARRRLTS